MVWLSYLTHKRVGLLVDLSWPKAQWTSIQSPPQTLELTKWAVRIRIVRLTMFSHFWKTCPQLSLENYYQNWPKFSWVSLITAHGFTGTYVAYSAAKCTNLWPLALGEVPFVGCPPVPKIQVRQWSVSLLEKAPHQMLVPSSSSHWLFTWRLGSRNLREDAIYRRLAACFAFGLYQYFNLHLETEF